jgi:hypothetical protein
MEMGRIAGQNDYRAGRVRLQLVGIELITYPNVEDAGKDGVYPVLGMPMRHQFHTELPLLWTAWGRLGHHRQEVRPARNFEDITG